MTGEPMISVQNLKWSKANHKILDIPAFSIRKHEVIALIGPNGAGKSSLLRILALLQHPDSGDLYFNGSLVQGNVLVHRRRIAMIFQEPLLLAGSVYKNVAQGLHYRGMKKDEIRQRVNYWLESFGIAHLIDRNQKTLSGGEAQRVSLARSLAIEPDILFLDEPFAALDQPTRVTLASEIGHIIRSRGLAAVFVTHNAEELSLFTDRICVMDQGCVIQEGSPEEIINRPMNDVTASLVGIENILPGVIEDSHHEIRSVCVNQVSIRFTGQAYEPGTAVKLYIRPENILLETAESQNSFKGIIETASVLNSQYKLRINCGFPLVALVSKGLFNLDQVQPGQQVSVCLPLDKIHVVRC